MSISLSKRAAAAGAIILLMSAGAGGAATLQVKVTNLQGQGGLFLTPIFSVFHDGSYDAFDAGQPASPGVEAIAEEGDPSVELAATAGETTGVVTAPGGFPGRRFSTRARRRRAPSWSIRCPTASSRSCRW